LHALFQEPHERGVESSRTSAVLKLTVWCVALAFSIAIWVVLAWTIQFFA